MKIDTVVIYIIREKTFEAKCYIGEKESLFILILFVDEFFFLYCE